MSEYTPTVWRTGDVITAEKLNKIEEGIANAEAGGESDFSTAEVTITSLNGNTILIPYVATDNGVSYLNEVVSDPETYNVALYDGKAMGIIFNPQGIVTTTGNITYADGTFLISGNGTIDIRTAV